MSEDNQHPPTARSGMKASMKAEHDAAQKGNPPPAEVKMNSPTPENNPTPANAQGESMMNPPQAQGEPQVDPDADALAVVFSEGEDGNAERAAFTREAVAAYRSMLVGIRTRLQSLIAHPQGLNPDVRADRASLTNVRRGIARCNAVLAELGDEQEPVEP